MSATYDLNGCQIFHTGRWNNDVYTEADLDAMVASFGQVGFVPPLKLGHDASQPMAKSDGMPAIGWVYNLRRVGTKLLCDIRQMPRKVYDAVKRKNYDRVSAEVYWDYDLNGKIYPRVLKALSLLGAEIPAVTSLAALETLYDASGKEFKRYDMFYPDSPSASTPQTMPMMGSSDDEDDNEDEGEKKDRETVNYRNGGEDLHKDGDGDYCGGCRFWCGPLDPNGENTLVACCSLVEGQIASSMLCDLHEDAEPFASTMKNKKIAVEIRDDGIIDSKNNTRAEDDPHSAVGDPAPEGVTQMAEITPAMLEGLNAQIAELTKKNQELSAETEATKASVKELSDQRAIAELRTTELEAEKASLAEQARQDGKKAWFATLSTEANLKILPVEKPIVEFLYEMLDGGAVKMYKATDGKELSGLETLKSLFEGRTPGTFLFKELSSSSATQDAGKPTVAEMSASEAKQELVNMAKVYMTEKQEKSFQVALKAIYAANPELKARSAGITPQGEAKEEAGVSSMTRMFKQ